MPYEIKVYRKVEGSTTEDRDTTGLETGPSGLISLSLKREVETLTEAVRLIGKLGNIEPKGNHLQFTVNECLAEVVCGPLGDFMAGRLNGSPSTYLVYLYKIEREQISEMDFIQEFAKLTTD